MDSSKLFINRKNEIAFLKKDVETHESASRLLIISAKTGIGKSTLVDEVLSVCTNDNFRVLINIDKADEIQDGYLIKQIARVLHKNATKTYTYFGIYEFIRSDQFYKNVANGVGKVILKYIGLDDFAEGFKEKNITRNTEIKSWMGDDNELLDICHRYIHYISNSKRLFLSIENFQVADTKSLTLLRDILNTSPNAYVIGEYTIETENEDHLYQRLELFANENIKVNNLRIEKLDKDELIHSIKDEKELLISIIERSYAESDGNLHKFKMLRNSSHFKKYDVKVSSYNNITKHLLASLDSLSIGIISIVKSHQGEVSIELFEFYMNYSVSFQFFRKEDYQEKIANLKELGLLSVSLNRISIKHDSISQEMLEVSKIKNLQVIAIRDWVRVYQYLERNSLNYEIDYIDNLLWQLFFLIKIKSFDEIAEVLEKLNKYILVAPTNTIIFHLDKIANLYQKNFSQESDAGVFKWLIVMYYRCGYSEKVINLCSPLLNTDPTIFLCYLAALSTSNPDDVLGLISDLSYQEMHIKLGFLLIEIRALRSSYKHEECKTLWSEHYRNGTFRHTSFEAGFLKYSTLVIEDDIPFRIKCLSDATSLFLNINDRHGLISSAIALSRDYAYAGDFQNSLNFLNKAEEMANTTIFPRYLLYNNRAVLDILTNKISQVTKDGLNNCLRICSNDGDRLIIESNLLVIAIVEHDDTYGLNICNKLCKKILKDFRETSDLTQVALYNCYRYFLMLDNTDQANFLKTYLVKMRTQEDPELWNYLLHSSGKNNYESVVRKEYYPVFMLDWEVDYYIALSNYQSEASKLQ